MDTLGLLLKFYIYTLAAQATGRRDKEIETATATETATEHTLAIKRCKVKDTQLLLSCAQVKTEMYPKSKSNCRSSLC